MATFKPNEHGIYNVLVGTGGPVGQFVRGFMAESQRLSKLYAPKNTGTLAASTRAVGPFVTPSGLEGTVVAHAINPRTGKDYALAVHQGHKEIVPVSAPYLKFKVKGKWVKTLHVRATAGKPFLIEGLSGANDTVGQGRFKIIVKRPPRTGS